MGRRTRRRRGLIPDNFAEGWYVRKVDARVVLEGPMTYRSCELLCALLKNSRPVYLTTQIAGGFDWGLWET